MFNQQQLKQAEAATLPEGDEPTLKPERPAEVASDKSIMDNTDIYYMPENFQKTNQVAGRNMNVSGVVILVLGILFLLILGGGLYVYLVRPEFLSGLFSGSSQDPITTQTPPVITDTVTPGLEGSPAARPTGAPKDTYLAFRSELELADTVTKYLAVFTRYGSNAKQQQLASQRASLESVGGQGDILSALRGTPVPPLDGTEEISEDITDERAVLTISKTSGKMTGTAVLIAENGEWRVSDETWIETSTGSEEETNLTAAADDDQDGLSNAEEALLGTNARASDSDTDGYNDAEELNNGYNPAGTGQLAANTNLGTYLNTTFNFSLLYPISWNRTIASTDDSVIFTAENRQFVQVLVQPNSNQADIVDWYRTTFNVQSIPNSQLIINESWNGVKTPDGLTVYLTNPDKTYIFVVTYNLSNSKTLEYKTVFDMIIRNLKLGA